MQNHFSLPLFLLATTVAGFADGPADNLADKVRRIPPPGLAIPADARTNLTADTARLADAITTLRGELTNKPALLALLPDVQIYHKAVDWALRFDEFYRTNETRTAALLLSNAFDRIAQLRAGRAGWPYATGLVVRGYVSRVDGSVQPYGLVVPPSYSPDYPGRYRLDFWFHGRGENLTELAFIADRQRSPGEFTPPNAFVLHLYGRYCNGSRFAGETDFWEAFDDVRRQYPIDEDRLVVRGFSLGGAACWHFATHYASRWAAAAPGAGFSETAEFLRVFQSETLRPAPWEQTLWRLYDSTECARNLAMVPTIAYSGEVDRQKQAADAMAAALKAEGMELTHIIGPKTAHSYEPNAKKEVNRRVDAAAARGRDPLPHAVHFVTYSLRYPDMAWVTVDALGRHWEKAQVDAEIVDASNVRATTRNVTALTLAMPTDLCPLDLLKQPVVELDGVSLVAPRPQTDRSWTAHFRKVDGAWTVVPAAEDEPGLRKRHGLQGPIDDAFMDSFLMVRGTGKSLNDRVQTWTAGEMAHAIEHWRRQFRGEPRIKDDTAVTDADLAAHNLVLWGDPASNRLLARIADQLPIRWDAQGVHTPDTIYPVDGYVPVLIYPNPLNPKRYVVINSGFTFREYDYLNNARQTPKLPDWVIVDLSQPPTSRAPGGLAKAGFFGEKWEWQK